MFLNNAAIRYTTSGFLVALSLLFTAACSVQLLPTNGGAGASEGSLETAVQPANQPASAPADVSIALTADDLAGTAWTLQSFGQRTALTEMAADSEVTAEFTSDGKLNGNATCNRYFTTFQVEDGLISVGAAGMTRMMCADETLQKQEQAFAGALESMLEPRSFSLSDGQLEIDLDDGQVLIFQAQQSAEQ